MSFPRFRDPVCDIVIPVWNQMERTKRCLDSLCEKTEEPIRLLLVDNGSDAATRDMLDRFQREGPIPSLIIRNPSNAGFIRATNQGIRAARAPWICLLNNDTVVTRGWLKEMIRAAEANPKIGLVNPTSNSLGFKAGNVPLDDYAASLAPQGGKWAELSTALGFCLLARRSLFDQVGLLDESFGMGNFDDDDLSRRVRKAGLTCARACASYVFHEEKASFRDLPGWEEAFDKNKRLFEKKWGRSLRILLALPGAPKEQAQAIAQAAIQLAREGHWVVWVAPKNGSHPELLGQAQLSWFGVPSLGWQLPALWRLLTKRRKPFQLVIGYDRLWLGWARRCVHLHQAAILETPSPQEILEKCRALSHSP